MTDKPSTRRRRTLSRVLYCCYCCCCCCYAPGRALLLQINVVHQCNKQWWQLLRERNCSGWTKHVRCRFFVLKAILCRISTRKHCWTKHIRCCGLLTFSYPSISSTTKVRADSPIPDCREIRTSSVVTAEQISRLHIIMPDIEVETKIHTTKSSMCVCSSH